jgi:hypothetical protein
MSNPRDTGRYDAFTDSNIDQQVRVDFAWGNMPMQPNDDRGMSDLDPALDSHEIATSGYEGFPAFLTGAPYDDTIPNVTIPNLVGLTATAAIAALDSAGLDYTVSTTSAGATSGNNNTIKQQTPASGMTFNLPDAPTVVITKYVNSNPILAMRYNMSMQNQGNIDMIIPGRITKPAVGNRLTIAGNSRSDFNGLFSVYSVANDDAYTTGSTKVRLNLPVGGDMDWHTGGTWVVLPHVSPASVSLETPGAFGPGSKVQVANGSLDGGFTYTGPIEIHIPLSSAAGDRIMYSDDVPTSNGWAGKTVTFSNMTAYMNPTPLSAVNGTKTIASSAVVNDMMNGNYIKLVFTDSTSIGYSMGYLQVSTGTMALDWVTP